MSYAAISDVQAKIPLFTISSTSKPNTSQVQGFIDQRSTEIDMAIRSRGIAVPVTDSGWLPELVLLNAKAAAGDTQNAAYPSDSGPGSTALGPSLLREYNTRLKEIKEGVGVPVAVTVMEADLAPRSWYTDNVQPVAPAGGFPLPEDSPGDTAGEPWFTRSMTRY